MSFSNKLMLKDWNWRAPITDILNLEENKLGYKMNNQRRKKVLRDPQIRNIHEMGNMKSAKELRVDEASVHKLRESHGTIQRLTSQLQEMQEQMNSIKDSREFQEVESSYSGRLSYVPSQSAVIPSSRSMLRTDKRLPFDTWNTSGLQKTFFW